MPFSMKNRGHLLYRKVYRTLRGRILSGAYEPGEQIETEQTLTRQFKASIITIRQAEQMLEDEGLLDKQQGRGTFVPLSVKQHLKILGVCGLNLIQGLSHRMGPYFSNLIVFSQEEAATRGVQFETVWLSSSEPERARAYCDEESLRNYMGFLFFACSTNHPLVKRVQELRMRYAVITAYARPEEPRQVWLDYPEAIRLALAEFTGKARSPLVVMGIDYSRAEVETILRSSGCPTASIYLPGDETRYNFEAAGYHRMRELIASGADLSRILFLDDVVAQGATRAMLKAGFREKDVELVIISSKEELLPLGFPATLVIHDTREEVSHAFSILERKSGKGDSVDCSWRSGFRVVRPGNGAV